MRAPAAIMIRILQIGGLLLAVAMGAWCDQAKGNPKAPPPPRPKEESGKSWVAKEGAPSGNALKGEDHALKGGPKGEKLGPRVVNPNNPLFRLYTATPEQRERALEKLD